VNRELGTDMPVRVLKARSWRKTPGPEVLIETGSSIKQRLKDGSVDLVLTDPPYFDDVQYGELSRILHLWLAQYSNLPAIDEMKEAVPNRTRGNDGVFYSDTIGKCLSESRRTLAPRGRLILTFHNKKMVAWKALCRALIESEMEIQAIAAIRAENDADHTKRNGRGMLHDLVLECAPRRTFTGISTPRIVYGAADAKDLVAMGIALGKAVSIRNHEELPTIYREEAKRLSLESGRIR
jgi:adenine-specific DNA methylase